MEKRKCGFCHHLLSEFAFFPIKNKGKSRSILIECLYTRKVTVNIGSGRAAADGNDLMRDVLLQNRQ